MWFRKRSPETQAGPRGPGHGGRERPAVEALIQGHSPTPDWKEPSKGTNVGPPATSVGTSSSYSSNTLGDKGCPFLVLWQIDLHQDRIRKYVKSCGLHTSASRQNAEDE